MVDVAPSPKSQLQADILAAGVDKSVKAVAFDKHVAGALKAEFSAGPTVTVILDVAETEFASVTVKV